METECKQLHQVIKQLRQAVRSTPSGPSDNNNVQQQQQEQEQQQEAWKQQRETDAIEYKRKMLSAQENFDQQLGVLRQEQTEEVNQSAERQLVHQATIHQVKQLEAQLEKLQQQQSQQVQQEEKSNPPNESPETQPITGTAEQDTLIQSLKNEMLQFEEGNKAMTESLAACQHENDLLTQQVLTLKAADNTAQQSQDALTPLQVTIHTLEQEKKTLSDSLAACEHQKYELEHQFSAVQAAGNTSSQALSELKLQNQK